MAKYDKDQPMQDPVLRCDSCQKMLLTSEVLGIGMCPECGNRRMRNVVIMNEEEQKQAEKWGLDPKFMARFEPVEDGDGK